MTQLLGTYWKQLILILAVILYPVFFTSGSLIGLAIMIAVYAIVGISLSLLTGEAGLISLGQAAFVGVGAYFCAALAIAGLPHLLAILIGGLLAGFFGILVGFTSLRLKLSYLAMATIAFQIIFISLVTEWSAVTGGINGLYGIPPISIFGYMLPSTVFYYVSWLIVFLVLWLSINLLRSPLGLFMVAIKDNEEAALSIGTSVYLHKLQIFFISAVFSGWAGGIYAFYVSWVGPDSFSIHISIVFLSLMVLGGVRPIWGGALGATIILLLPEAVKFISRMAWLPSWLSALAEDHAFQLLVYSVLTLLILLFVPGGLGRLLAGRRQSTWIK